MEYSCEYCIAKEFMGARKGRLCFLFQLDFDEYTLEYDCKVPDGEAKGEVHSLEEFYSACSRILGLYKINRIEVALKQFKLKNSRLYGICPKSFPRSDEVTHLLSLINLCVGGQSGTELMQLPYPGTILEQPNKFIEAYYIFTNEYNKYVKSKTPKDKNENKR